MKTSIKIVLLTVNCLLLTVFVSCTLIDLEDKPEPQPTTGKVTLVTDWSNRTEGITIPASYTAIVNNQPFTLYNTSYTLPEILAGTYSATIYNTTDKITINETTASVKTENITVDPAPGWLFTYTGEITFEAGKEKTVTATMVQQVRQLSFDFTITGGSGDELQSVTASLSGVANSMDFETDTHTGTGLNVIPTLTKDGNKLSGAIRLIGITGTQNLILNLKYTDGKEQTLETNITDKLTGFNQHKHKVMTLSADIEISSEAGFEATINKWEAKEGSGGVAW